MNVRKQNLILRVTFDKLRIRQWKGKPYELYTPNQDVPAWFNPHLTKGL